MSKKAIKRNLRSNGPISNKSRKQEMEEASTPRKSSNHSQDDLPDPATSNIVTISNSQIQAASLQGQVPITYEVIQTLEAAVKNEHMSTDEEVTKEKRNAAFHVDNHNTISMAIERQSDAFFTAHEIPVDQQDKWKTWDHDRLFKVLKDIYRIAPVPEAVQLILLGKLQKLPLTQFLGEIEPGTAVAEAADRFGIRIQNLLKESGIENYREIEAKDERSRKIVSNLFDRFKEQKKISTIIQEIYTVLESTKAQEGTIKDFLKLVGKTYQQILETISQSDHYRTRPSQDNKQHNSTLPRDKGRSRNRSEDRNHRHRTVDQKYGECDVCGLDHELASGECQKRSHPDAATRGKPFRDTEKGRSYRNLGLQGLRKGYRLNKAGTELVKIHQDFLSEYHEWKKSQPKVGSHHSPSLYYAKIIKHVTWKTPISEISRSRERDSIPSPEDTTMVVAGVQIPHATVETIAGIPDPTAGNIPAPAPVTETQDHRLPQEAPVLPTAKPLAETLTAVVADGTKTRGSRSALLQSQLVPQSLIDTGASTNFISKHLCNKFNLKLIKTKTLKISTLYGSTLAHYQVVIPKLRLIYKNTHIYIHNQTFVVLTDITFPIIIGLPTIRNHDLTEKLKPYFRNEKERITRSKLSAKKTEIYLNTILVKTWKKTPEDKGVQAGPRELTKPLVSPTPQGDPTSPTKNQSAAATSTTSTNQGHTVHRSELLSGDNETTDTLDTPDSPWHKYFEDAQSCPGPVAPIQWDIHRSGAERDILLDVLSKNSERFASTITSAPALLPPFEIRINQNAWMKTQSRSGYVRPQSPEKDDAMRKFIEKALADDLIEPSQAARFSQVLLTMKPNGTYRFCVDYRELNSVSDSLGWPIPNIKGLLNRIGARKPKFFAVMDLTSGYHQAPLGSSSRQATAFITSMGLFQWKRVPMGPKGAPSYFQSEMVNTVFPGLIHHILEVYLDDIITWANTIEELADNLQQIFDRLRQFNITLNPEKCRFGMTEVEYVGHVIDEHGLSFSSAKLDKVETFRRPESLKHLRSFLGLASYFRDHIRNHAEIVHPLQELLDGYTKRTAASTKIKWTEALNTAFEQTKEAVINCPKLHFLLPGQPIFLHTDASDYGIGAYLFQLVNDVEQPIAFLSRTLTKTERKWSTLEKEAYAIYFALTKWEHYLRDAKFTLRTDHKNLTYMNQHTSPKVQRWKLAVQEYDFVIEHIKGTDNVVADSLSRFCPYPVDTPQSEELLLNALAEVLEETPDSQQSTQTRNN